MFRYFLVLALVPAILGQLQVQTCSDGIPPPAEVNMTCSPEPCNLVINTTITLGILFDLPQPVASLAAVLSLYENGVGTEIGTVPDICFVINGGCSAGFKFFQGTYVVSSNVASNSIVEVKFVAPGDNIIACGQFTYLPF